MKNGTIYAGKLRKAYTKLRQAAPKFEVPEASEPLRQLGVGILSVGCTEADAERAIDRALTNMVDWNEVRISSAFELNKATGNAIPQGAYRCQELVAALQDIYDRENRLSLDRLKNLGRREARAYLDQLAGVSEYATASVLLWSLGGHAIPVNDRLLQALRDADLVNPSADRAEVQAFLERHVGANEAKEFCLVMRSFADDHWSALKRRKKTIRPKKKKTASRSK